MEKQCTKCKEVKPLEAYHRHKQGKFGRHPKCIECNKGYHKQFAAKYYLKNKDKLNAKNKAYTESKKDGNYHVYTIDNYAGITTRPDTRLQSHKYFGRDGNTWRVLYSTPSESEALELEALLHDEGYEGRHVNALK